MTSIVTLLALLCVSSITAYRRYQHDLSYGGQPSLFGESTVFSGGLGEQGNFHELQSLGNGNDMLISGNGADLFQNFGSGGSHLFNGHGPGQYKGHGTPLTKGYGYGSNHGFHKGSNMHKSYGSRNYKGHGNEKPMHKSYPSTHGSGNGNYYQGYGSQFDYNTPMYDGQVIDGSFNRYPARHSRHFGKPYKNKKYRSY